MSRQLTADLHPSLRGSVDKCYSSFICCYPCVCMLGEVLSFFTLLPCLVSVLSSKPVYLPCFPSPCAAVLLRPDGSIPGGWMTVSAPETLIQACVCDRLIGAVTHRQVSASRCLFSPVSLRSLLLGRRRKLPYQEEAVVVNRRLLGLPVWGEEENLVRNWLIHVRSDNRGETILLH